MNPKQISGETRRPIGIARGFTLLELLVAMSITVLLAGLMLTVITGALTMWHRAQNRFATAAQAKLALDMIERDLQAAVFRLDGGTWLAVDVSNLPSALATHGWLTAGIMKPAGAESLRLLPDSSAGTARSVGEARFGLSGAWLRFITTNVEADGSLPIAVSCQIARRPLSGGINPGNPAAVRYTLFRAAVSAEGTLASGNDVVASAYNSTSVNPSATRSPATLTNPNSADALATNVVDFGVWLYVRDTADGLRRIFPVDDSDTAHAARDLGPAPDANRFPEAADVLIRILTEEGATLLSEMESGKGWVARPAAYATDAAWWWVLVEANSHVYTRRVEIKRTVR